MGSYAAFSLGGYALGSTYGGLNRELMLLFDSSDKSVLSEWGEDDPEVESGKFIEYRSSVAKVRDRLELMGFTLERAKRDFALTKEERAATARSMWRAHAGGGEKSRVVRIRNWDGSLSDLPESSPESLALGRELVEQSHWAVKAIEAMDFESWIRATVKVMADDLLTDKSASPRPEGWVRFPKHWPEDIAVILYESQEGLCMPCGDLLLSVRALIEAFDPETSVSYDLSDMVDAGYLDSDEDSCQWARESFASDLRASQKLLVITEGRSDKRCIELGLQVLRPHLSSYVAFLDFEATQVPGGVESVVNIMKAFAAAGIPNRVVAVLDNDTAGRGAEQVLKALRLPSNFRVVRLPDLELARRYPTLGPQGLVSMDVNGLAGSIELYLGADVLRQSDGEFSPVHWSAFDKRMKQYQGAVTDKDEVQKAFERKALACLQHPEAARHYDWSGVLAVLERIFQAFQGES